MSFQVCIPLLRTSCHMIENIFPVRLILCAVALQAGCLKGAHSQSITSGTGDSAMQVPPFFASDERQGLSQTLKRSQMRHL